jgi:hypothetical protein
MSGRPPAAPFVNTGLQRWEKMRAEWVGPKPTTPRRDVVKAKPVDLDDVIERIFSQACGGELPVPLPLGQMIDILIDFWEADGLYD